MNKPPPSTLLILAGLSVSILSLLADMIGLGDRGGVPAVQILGVELGIILALLGAWCRVRRTNRKALPEGILHGLPERHLFQPLIVWVLLGFLLSWFFFFIAPTFLNPANRFQYPADFFIEREHIGFDTRLTLEHVRVWFTGERQAKYIFPPLTTILFTPLLLLRYPVYYHVVTAITLASILILNLFLPLRMIQKENHLLVYFLFGISITSYGLQFELETGQFYTLAMVLSLAAIYVFHAHPPYRFFAYVLFCLSVQLKVFPAIFILMFVDDWRDWKATLKRFTALGIANFLLLFLLGFSYFNSFFQHLVNDTNTQELEYNHSIYAFVTNLSTSGYGLFKDHALVWMRDHSGGIETFLILYFLACLLRVLWRAYSQNRRGFDPFLLMTCTLGGLMLPAISHDYTLPLLTAPFMLVVSGLNLPQDGWKRPMSIGLLVLASFAYSATLVPWNARPAYLHNAFPLLFMLLTGMTLLEIMQEDEGE